MGRKWDSGSDCRMNASCWLSSALRFGLMDFGRVAVY
jgi:hypothetical protein